MTKKFVRINSRVDCSWEGLDPVYRLYVNDELFAERTWRWAEMYLEESLQIEAEPGVYRLRYELVEPHLAELNIGALAVKHGPAEIIDNQTFRIV